MSKIRCAIDFASSSEQRGAVTYVIGAVAMVDAAVGVTNERYRLGLAVVA